MTPGALPGVPFDLVLELAIVAPGPCGALWRHARLRSGVSDEKNLEEMRKLGLAKPAPVVDNTPAPVAPKENANVPGNS